MKKQLMLLVLNLVLGSVLVPVVATAATLTAAERDGLVNMREEEKLARDVYLALYRQWGIQIFSNISASEQTHMDRVKILLSTYNISDPSAGKLEGEFVNPVFLGLYNDLVASGSESLIKALEVGVFIEETDIDDLTFFLAQTNRKDIRNVYTNIRNGSYNHLDAFTSLLAQ